jgi:hypothetical protein
MPQQSFLNPAESRRPIAAFSPLFQSVFRISINHFFVILYGQKTGKKSLFVQNVCKNNNLI